MITISVITVARNAAKTIESTIRSVAEQSYPHIEHIVVDGGSTDGTQDLILKYRNRIAAFVSETDNGMYDAMNKGLRLANGAIIGFLNADDVYSDSRTLDTIVQTMEARKVDACYGDLVYVDKKNPDRVVRYWRSQSYCEGLFEKGWMPAHPTFYARRWVYDKFGGYDLAYRYQSDFELTMRFLAIKKISSAYIPRVLVKMRSGGASRGLRHILMGNIEAYVACRRHSLRVTPLFIAKKIFSRIPQFFRLNQADL
jgi:glycosyltransferase involved in cell wall biosynthesis